MSNPIPPYLVDEGAHYWASWGNKGWTAVRVSQVKTKYAVVQRLNPLTNEVMTERARVKLDELVKRIPSMLGEDKPTTSPGAVFARVRLDRA